MAVTLLPCVESCHLPSLIAGVFVGGLFVCLLQWASSEPQYTPPKLARRELQARLARKQEQRMKEPACLSGPKSISTATERAVALDSTAAQLRDAIREGRMTSEEVLLVLIHRSHVLGHSKLCNVTDEMYDEALQAAREADKRVAQMKKGGKGEAAAAGLLLGVPISIKDHIDVKGTDSTCGLAANCLQPAEQDALIVELLKDAGAVPYCKTNVPQLLMLPESFNRVFGAALNPWNTKRSPGGSSGGEGGLIAARGSLLGIGTDVAGSIRIPANCCGVYGFRPTPARVSDKGLRVPFPRNRWGQTAIKAAAGPLGVSVEDLALVCRAWWVDKMWERDPQVTPKRFDEQAYSQGAGRPLRIAYFTTDEWFQPPVTMVRAVKEAAAGLKQAGHEVVDVTGQLPMNGWEAARLLYGIMASEGNMKGYVEALQGEALIPQYNKVMTVSNLPNILRPPLRAVLRLAGERRLEHLVKGTRDGGMSTRRYWDLLVDHLIYKDAFLDWMDEQRIDALLCPGLGLPALPHGMSDQLESIASYTFFVNLLHFPAGSVPVTTVRQDEAHYYPMQELPSNQRDSIARSAAKAMEGSEGLPVNVQLVTRPNQDELCLHVMKQLEASVGFKAVPEIAKHMTTGQASS